MYSKETPLSGFTQTDINQVIDICITQGHSISILADKLTKDQLVAFIDTTSRATMETQIQTRSLAKSIVAFLFELSRVGSGHYQKLRDKVKSEYNMTVNDYSSLQYWGLISPATDEQTGFWEITTTGKDFLNNKIELPSQLIIHNNRVIDKGKKMVSIQDFDVLAWRGYEPKKKNNPNDLVDVLLK